MFDQVSETATKAIELPDHQYIALAERLQARLKVGPVVALAGGFVLIDALGRDSRANEGVVLEVSHLTTIGLGHSGISDQHSVYRKRSFVLQARRTPSCAVFCVT